MSELGHFALSLSWLLALYGLVAGIFGAATRRSSWFLSVVNSTRLVFVCCAISILALAYMFHSDDYSNQYVWQFSNRAMDDVYKVSAIWGGMDGSMLLWCLFLTLSGALVALRASSGPRELMPWVLPVVNSSSLFFLTVVLFCTNPFRYLKAPMIPPDGNGLNPLLQNPYMAVHPPMLYAGFTTLSVPFAFCIGALLAGRLGNDWIRLTRRWTLIAWGFLTAGIVMGGHWAYIELGWGGFWAWDPVENASFLPWLTGTAFLHSVMVQERKDMLKFWNVWLVVVTYALTVFGTFLTRSGVVQSVHAFASTDVGWVFLLYLGIIFVVTAALTVYRRVELSSQRRIESYFSREAAFLINNLVLISICFATLWGVMFPVLSEAVTGSKQTVSIPFFNAVNVPLFLLLIFMMGVGPLIAWRKASWQSMKKTFLSPFVSGLLAALALMWAGVHDFYPLLSYGLCFFVLMTILGEFHRGMRVQRATGAGDGLVSSATTLIRRHRTRYGGYLVHFGVLVMTVGITASMAHKTEREFSLASGEKFAVGRYVLELDGMNSGRTGNYEFLSSIVSVRSPSGELLGELHPELRLYFRNKETTTEVALRSSMRDDLYLVLAGFEEKDQRAALKVFVNPLQAWLWVGALIVVLGTLVLAIPGALVAARVGEPALVADNTVRSKS